jgi:hypothetical protein
LRNFLAALAGECENFKDGPERAWHTSPSQNYRRQFLVIQGAVARTIRRAEIKSLDGREIDHSSAYAPPKEGLQDLGDVAIGPRASLSDLAHEIDDVSPFNVMDAFGAPSRDDVIAEPIGDGRAGPQAGQPLNDKRLNKSIHPIDDQATP